MRAHRAVFIVAVLSGCRVAPLHGDTIDKVVPGCAGTDASSACDCPEGPGRDEFCPPKADGGSTVSTETSERCVASAVFPRPDGCHVRMRVRTESARYVTDFVTLACGTSALACGSEVTCDCSAARVLPCDARASRPFAFADGRYTSAQVRRVLDALPPVAVTPYRTDSRPDGGSCTWRVSAPSEGQCAGHVAETVNGGIGDSWFGIPAGATQRVCDTLVACTCDLADGG